VLRWQRHYFLRMCDEKDFSPISGLLRGLHFPLRFDTVSCGTALGRAAIGLHDHYPDAAYRGIPIL
jgi:hypothetical protein